MEDFGTSTQLTAIIVGDHADQFVRHAGNLLVEYDIEFIVCRDIYSATVRLAKCTQFGGLVIGRLEQLGKEKGRFFHIAKEHGHSCCCLTRQHHPRSQLFQTAKETEVSIINEPSELTGVVARFLASSCKNIPSNMINRGSLTFIKDEFLTTKDELDALLETNFACETENIFD